MMTSMVPSASAWRSALVVAHLMMGGVAAAQATTAPQATELSVSGIFLADPSSVASVLGQPPPPTELGDDFPTLQVCNTAKTELLVLVFHYGSSTNSYNQIRVRDLPKASPPCLALPGSVTHFVTGKGVRLGMLKVDLIRTFGQGYSESRQGTNTIVSYKIEGIDKSPLLQRFNTPKYAGSYRFRNDKLLAFEFGFPYP
jgi:hypothetical protein